MSTHPGLLHNQGLSQLPYQGAWGVLIIGEIIRLNCPLPSSTPLSLRSPPSSLLIPSRIELSMIWRQPLLVSLSSCLVLSSMATRAYHQEEPFKSTTCLFGLTLLTIRQSDSQSDGAPPNYVRTYVPRTSVHSYLA